MQERIAGTPARSAGRSAALSKAVILCADRTPWLTDSSIELQRDIQLLNRPLLNWQLEALQAGGIQSICVARPGETSSFAPLEGGVFTWRHANPMGSAGVLAPLRHWLGEEPFLLVCSSTFIDAAAVVELVGSARPSDRQWAGTLAIGCHPPGFDAREALVVDPRGRVHHIDRRHRSEDRRTTNYVTGLFVLSGRALSLVPDGQYFDLKDQLMPALRERGFFFATRLAESSVPLLRPEDHLTLQARLLAQREAAPAPARSAAISPEASLRGCIEVGEGVVIEAGARIVGPVVLGPGCRIGQGTTLIGPSCLGSRCVVNNMAVLVTSLLEEEVVLGAGSHVEHSLLAVGHVVEPGGLRAAADELAPPLSAGPGRRRSGAQARLPATPAFWASAYDLIKRVLDLGLAALLTVLLLPLGLLIAAAVKLDSPGPVLYVQRRCGHGGREFPLLKFRTMVTDADRLMQELRKVNEMDGPTFKMARDPRVTRLGAWLRRTSLDELPQLLNVLAGQMSLVGPRPLKMTEMVSNAHWRDVRLSVMPGITGLWQVEGRDSRHFHHWVQLDLEYVRNRSLLFDLKILFRTAGVLRRGT